MEEIWKNVIGFELYYMVSNLGRVKSISRLTNFGNKRIGLTKEKILKRHPHRNGYLAVTLSKQGVSCKYLIHRLLAESFIPKTENKSQVNHINGIKTDNRVENLEWCTPSENIRHYFKLSGKVPFGHLFTKQSKSKYTKSIICNETGKIYSTGKAASLDLQIDHSTISKILFGKVKQSGGYSFKRYKTA